jgi:hypothetical protein
MAHDVIFKVPPRELGRADIKFSVKRSGAKLGTLTVSRGSVVWFQRDRSWGFKMGWRDFDRMMAVNGKRWEKR